MSIKINNVINFQKTYIIVDFEANGDLENPYLVQIGALKIENHQIIDSFNQWCYYDGEISNFIAFLLNKDRAFYLQQKTEKTVWKEFLNFCDNVDQIFNFGKYYDELIIKKVHERTHLPIIKLIDLQAKYFNLMCGIKHYNQAVVSLDVVNSVFCKQQFHHINHDAYQDCLMLFHVIEKCFYYETHNYSFLVQQFHNAYLMPRLKNFRGISKKIKALEYITLKNQAPIIFIYHWSQIINETHISYKNNLYLINKDGYQKIATFELTTLIGNKHDFYANFAEVEVYLFNNIGLNNAIFVSNIDFLIKKIQTSYASKTKKYPLIYWIPFEWIKVSMDWDVNTLDNNQLQKILNLLQKIYLQYWKIKK